MAQSAALASLLCPAKPFGRLMKVSRFKGPGGGNGIVQQMSGVFHMAGDYMNHPAFAFNNTFKLQQLAL